jgi:fructan beta-fructosidase
MINATATNSPGKANGLIKQYDEKYRPQFHFTAKKNWINDPNGLVYLDGEYHLFFQHNPFGTQWGHMSWGHAVSKDMLHWTELPVAIPEGEDDAIFSGSAVFDKDNTSGLGTLENPPIIAIYTSNSDAKKIQTQAIAFSLDKGRTFTKYAHNPVIDLKLEHFRDPKVFWDAERKNWVMVIALPKERKISIYTSPNLINWTHQSDFGPQGAVGGDWECPDLVELSIDGVSKEKAWVLLVSLNPGGIEGGSGTQYFVGDFNGKEFIPNNNSDKPLWVDYGRDNYAGVTFNNLPDDRKVFIGWMVSWAYASSLPKTAWTGAMTVPRELSLQKAGNSLALVSKPIRELESLQVKQLFSATNLKMKDYGFIKKVSGKELDISFNIIPGKSKKSWINVLAGKKEFTQIGYDADSGEVFLNRGTSSESMAILDLLGVQKAPLGKVEKVRLRILVDRSSVEVFVNDGQFVMTDVTFPDSQKSDGVAIFSENKDARITDLNIHSLASTWR